MPTELEEERDIGPLVALVRKHTEGRTDAETDRRSFEAVSSRTSGSAQKAERRGWRFFLSVAGLAAIAALGYAAIRMSK